MSDQLQLIWLEMNSKMPPYDKEEETDTKEDD
jgi:hypothetical protein